MKLELIAVPVSDVDRSKSFYVDQVGFNADHDHTTRDELAGRGVNITEVEQMPWGARHAHFTDPDGNPWDLQEPAVRS